MKWLIVFLVLLTGLFAAWYFFAPEYLLEPEPSTVKAPDPIEAAIDTLFQPGEPVADREGNVYPTVRVGGQQWLAANLKVIECNATDGTTLRWGDGWQKGPDVEIYSPDPRFGYYAGKEDSPFGVLYNLHAVTRCRLCPTGWRVANKTDWETLFAAIGPESFRGNKLRAANGSPFVAPLGGRIDSYGSVLAGRYQFWWTSDPHAGSERNPTAWAAELSRNGEVAIKPQDQRTLNYVRCVKD